MMRAWALRCLTALGVVALMLVPRASQAQDETSEDQPLVRSVELRGVSNVDIEELRAGLVTRGTHCKNFLYTPICLVTRSPLFTTRRYLNTTELRRDALRIRLFYWRRGYRDVSVNTEVNQVRGGVRVVFDIAESEPTIVEAISVVQTDSVLRTTEIRRALQLQPNQPLDLIALDSSTVLLRNELWERGYADARVEVDTSRVDNARNAGPVSVILTPGPVTTVHAVDVVGTNSVSEATVRRIVLLRPGDLYRRSRLLESQRDLYLSGLFSEVEMRTVATRDSAKTLVVVLAEAPLRNLELVGGFTTIDFLQLESTFTRYNFVGGARRLTLRGTVSNLLAAQLNGSGPFYDVTSGAEGSDREPFLRPTWAASIEYLQPWFFARENQLGVSVFSHRRSVPSVVTDRGYGGTLGLTRRFGVRTNGTLGYTYERSRVEASDVYFCISLGICVPTTVSIIAAPHALAPVAFVAQYDRTNDALAPTHGVRARLDLEHASRLTTSDYEYNRAAFTASQYFPVGRQNVLAARVRLGLVRALSGSNRSLQLPPETEDLVLHPRKLFFSGGSQSVRGYGENQLGPRILTIDPAKLTDTALANPCSTAQIANRTCNPNKAGLGSGEFQPRPLGGTALAEASVEYRFPLRFVEGLSGAVFLDGALVGTRRFSDLFGATGAITPGFGVRFNTPVGPVRLDLGVRPTLIEELPVVTQVSDSSGNFQLVTLNMKRRFDQAEATGGALSRILSRLTLHLAIGPAF